MESKIHEYVRAIPIDNILRIDIGLEGDWSSTAVTVWTRDNGLLGFDEITRSHAINKPSLEFYYGDSWLGIHCFQRDEEKNFFDEELARKIIQFIESNMQATKATSPPVINQAEKLFTEQLP